MSQFSKEMRNVAKELLAELGDKCILTKVDKGRGYNPMTGENENEVLTNFNTFSTSSSNYSYSFGSDGQNTNLSGFSSRSVVVPWIGQPIDETWLYNGHNITSVSSDSSDNDIIVYSLVVGEKR